MSDICKSCGEHFTNHLGLEGTCRLLQECTEERDELKDQVFDLSQWESRGKYLEERMSVMREDAVSRFNRIKEYRVRVAQLEGALRAVQKHQVATGGEMAKHGSVYLICEKALNPDNP